MRIFLLLSALTLSACIKEAAAADFNYGCVTLGADAGNNVLLYGGSNSSGGPMPNTQFMVNTTLPVTYRVCKTSAGIEADGGPSCKALSTDAPIPANTPTDLCMPTGYPYLSFYKLYDGGNPTICPYLVTPKTVCQINNP